MAQKKPWKSDKTKEQIQEDRQTKVNDIKASAAKKIIDLIESGQSLEWRKSWKGTPFFDMPHNPVSGHRFTGFNRVIAMMEMLDRGGSDSRFMTFPQIKDFNKANNTECHVKKGETAIYLLKPIVFNKKEDSENGHTDESKGDDENIGRKLVFFQPYPVFHASQIEGMPPAPEPATPDWEQDLLIENLIEASGAEFRHGGDRAFFSPSRDYCQMPFPADFTGKDSYYATKLHEFYHWTGHPTREHREFGVSFGDEKYAIEELRAESFSVLAGMALGLPSHIEDHAAYIKSWNSKLETKDGVEEIMRCIHEAGKMLDVVLEFKSEEKPSVDWWPEAPEAVQSPG